MEMQAVQNSSDPLTYGEYRQRLLEKFEKNPNDPELQDLKKSLEGSVKNFIQDTTQNLRGFIDSPLFQNTLKSIPPPSTLITTNLIPSQIQKELTYLSPPGDPHGVRLARIEEHLERLRLGKPQSDYKYGLARISNQHIPLTDQNILLKAIPERNRKYKNARRVASLLLGSDRVDNWLLAQRLNPTILSISVNKRRKFYKRDYLSKKGYYNQQIKNCLRTLKKLWNPLSHTIKFHPSYSEMVSLEE